MAADVLAATEHGADRAAAWGGGRALAHTLATVSVNAFTVTDEDMRPVALALYPEAARWNHDCEPSCAATFHGPRLSLRALRAARAGEELTLAYIDVGMPAACRREALRGGYGFDCDCTRCRSESVSETAATPRPAPVPSLEPASTPVPGSTRAPSQAPVAPPEPDTSWVAAWETEGDGAATAAALSAGGGGAVAAAAHSAHLQAALDEADRRMAAARQRSSSSSSDDDDEEDEEEEEEKAPTALLEQPTSEAVSPLDLKARADAAIARARSAGGRCGAACVHTLCVDLQCFAPARLPWLCWRRPHRTSRALALGHGRITR